MGFDYVTRLLGDLDAFREKYWTQRPVVSSAAGNEFTQSLFSLADADEILSSSVTRPPYVELKRGGYRVREGSYFKCGGTVALPIPDAIDTDAVAAEFARGASILFQDIHDYHPANIRLCSDFARTFSAATKSVGFITPPGHQGHGPHFDAFEGFIIQTHGTKTWALYERIVPLPASPQGLRESDLGEQVMSVTLREGDCLYVPWGYPHQAVAGEDVSCHITVTVIPPSWSRVMTDYARSLIPQAAFDRAPDLITRRPDELARELRRYLSALVDELDAADAGRFGQLAAEYLRHTAPQQAGFVEQAMLLPGLTMTSTVTRNPQVSFTVESSTTGGARVRLGVRTIRVPDQALDLLARLEKAHRTSLSSLAAGLDQAMAVKLVGEMTRGGAVTIDPRGPQQREQS